jgi:hypothetical protein
VRPVRCPSHVEPTDRLRMERRRGGRGGCSGRGWWRARGARGKCVAPAGVRPPAETERRRRLRRLRCRHEGREAHWQARGDRPFPQRLLFISGDITGQIIWSYRTLRILWIELARILGLRCLPPPAPTRTRRRRHRTRQPPNRRRERRARPRAREPAPAAEPASRLGLGAYLYMLFSWDAHHVMSCLTRVDTVESSSTFGKVRKEHPWEDLGSDGALLAALALERMNRQHQERYPAPT